MSDQTIADYVREQGITATVTSGPTFERDDDGWEHNAYRVTLRRPGARPWSRINYRMGLGLQDAPTAEDVVNSLLLDAWSADEDFEDWCGEFGYDSDSRKAYAMYRACVRARERMIEFLGSVEEFERAATEFEQL